MFDFIKKKLIRFYPVLIFVMMLSFMLSLISTYRFTFYDNIFTLLFLNGTPLVLNHGNQGVFWYVSSMLWTMLLFFYLLKNYKEKNVELFFALLIFFAYGFIIHAKKGALNAHTETFYCMFNIGMLRALGGIALGYFIGKWYKLNNEKIRNFIPKLWQKLTFTLLEFMCLYFIINNLMLHKLHFKNHFLFILVFCIIIILFLAKKGYAANLLDKKCCVDISKYTYSFYMTHWLAIDVLTVLLWKTHPGFVRTYPIINLTLALLIIFLLGIFTYHAVEKPFADILGKALPHSRRT